MALVVCLSGDYASHAYGQTDAPAASKISGSEVEIECVYFMNTPQGVKGGTSPVTIRVFPNKSRRASVGVMEEFYNGTGEMWRTSAWIAAFNAARVNGTSIVDHEFLVKANGHIDGPSAGMLFTCAMLASIRGDEVRADTTMTGTINPDGTAGPVGGIPQKMEGAKAAGRIRFGYPVGCRTSVDQETKETVDLNARGADLDMEVKEIRDVYEAYEFLTGVKLERTSPASESDMDLSASPRTKIEGWTLRIENQLKLRIGRITEDGERNPMAKKMFGMFIDQMNQLYNEGIEFRRSSLVVAAYDRFVECDSMARAIEAMIDVIPAFETRKFESLQKHLLQAKGRAESNERAFQLQARGSLTNRRLGGRIDSINNVGNLVEAMSYSSMALDSHRLFEQNLEILNKLKAKGLDEKQEEQILMSMTQHFVFACLFYEAAGVTSEYAEDWLSIDSNLGENVDVDPEHLEALARAYTSAGNACQGYFDALVTKESAQARGISVAAMQNLLSITDTQYPYAKKMADIASNSRLKISKNSLENCLFKLGAGSEAYLTSASLANKYYSLGAKATDDGVSISKKKMLSVMLRRARLQALEEAGNMKAVHGFIPDSAKIAFQLGTALREGSDEDKLHALSAFWRASYLCDIADAMVKK